MRADESQYARHAADSALKVGAATTAIGIFTLLATATRLWNLHLPATPIYDETHVGRFLNWYHERAFFFDVHGPLAKLLMYWTATALGFDGRASCPYESTQPFAANCSLGPQRLVPALCGAAMVPLTFATCCAMRLHPLAAFLCGWLVLIDTLWLGLSRVHLNDMVQMLFIGLTHRLALRACEPPPAPPIGNDDEAGSSSGNSHWLGTVVSLTATGLSLGCALQCKYAMALTTLGWLGLQNLVTLGEMIARGNTTRAILGQAIIRGLLLLGIPLLLHLVLLKVHLAHVPNSGNGDGYLSERFQATLVGNRHANSVPTAVRPAFLSLAAEHAQAQFWYNRNMAILFPHGSHPFDTAWYTWPLAARGVYFGLVSNWNALAGNLDGRHTFGFFLHPNPVITLLSTFSAAAALLSLACRICRMLRPWPCGEKARSLARSRVADALRPGGSGSLLVAYLIHWLPYATQDRQTFLLYYLPAYFFAILLLGRVWHAVVCAHCRPTVATLATLVLCWWTGSISWRILPIAYGSAVRLFEWTAALRLASTECWNDAQCWVDVRA